MADLTLLSAASQKYDIGRCVVMDGPYWDGTTNLTAGLTHLGNTQGEVKIVANSEYNDLVVKESFGPAILKRYIKGDKPTFDLGLFPTPELMAKLSPTGTASMGNARQRVARTRTLWIVAEQLFLKQDPMTGAFAEVEVGFDGTDWTKDGDPFTEDDQRLFDMSAFVWKAQSERLTPTYKDEDGGLSLVTVPVNCLLDLNKPDGHMLITIGAELADSGIDIGGTSS